MFVLEETILHWILSLRWMIFHTDESNYFQSRWLWIRSTDIYSINSRLWIESFEWNERRIYLISLNTSVLPLSAMNRIESDGIPSVLLSRFPLRVFHYHSDGWDECMLTLIIDESVIEWLLNHPRLISSVWVGVRSDSNAMVRFVDRSSCIGVLLNGFD